MELITDAQEQPELVLQEATAEDTKPQVDPVSVPSKVAAAALTGDLTDASTFVDTALRQYFQIQTEGFSPEVDALANDEAEDFRGQLFAEELAKMDPDNITQDDLFYLQEIQNMPISGDPVLRALGTLFGGLDPEDVAFRTTDNPATQFHDGLRLSDEEEAAFAEADALLAKRDGLQEGWSIHDVADYFGTKAEEIKVLRMGGTDEEGNFDHGLLAELLDSILPVVSQYNWFKAAKSSYQYDPDWTEAAFAGETIHALKNILVNAPPEDRADIAEAIYSALMNNSGAITKYGNGSSLEAWANLSSMADFDAFLYGDTDWTRWLEDSITVIDALPLLGGVAKGLRASVRGLGRLFSKGQGAVAPRVLAATDKSEVAKQALAAGAVSPTRDIDNALGMTIEDHICALLPNIKASDNIDVLPDYTRQVIERNRQLGTDIVENLNPTSVFFDLADDALVAKTIEKFRVDTGGALQPTRSQIGEIEGDTFNYVAQFGATEDSGFRNMTLAQEWVEQNLGVDANVKYFDWDRGTGKYTEIVDTTTVPKEVVVRYDTKLHHSNELADVFGGELSGLWFGPTRVQTNWLTSGSGRYNENMRQAITRAVDRTPAVQQRLSDMIRPFERLSRADQRAVISVEMEGTKLGKDWTPQELVDYRIDGKPLTDKQMAGYYGRLQARRTMYVMENKTLRDKLLSENMRQVASKDETFKFVGKPLAQEDDPKNGVWAYNPSTKKVTKLTQTDVDALYSSGGGVVRGWREIVQDGSKAEYMVFDGYNTVLKDLPNAVLRYMPGWNPRYYNANWYVRRKAQMRVNGKMEDSTITVAGAHRHAEAAAMVRRQKNPEEYVIEFDKAKATGFRDSDIDNYELENMMFYNQRSPQEIAALRGDITDDPTRALKRSISTVSEAYSSSRLREIMQQKFTNTFKDMMPMRRGEPQYPQTKADIVRPPVGTKGGLERYRQARALHDYIRLSTGGMSSDQRKYYDMVLSVAAAADAKNTVLSNKLATILYNSVDKGITPQSLLKTTAFTMQLATAPLRSAFINAHQSLFLIGIEPRLTLQAIAADQFYLNSAFMAERAGVRGRKWAEAIGNGAKKTFGALYNTDEMEHLYKQWSLSGMPYMRANLPLEDVSFGDGLLNAVTEVGYSLGERLNLGATYAVAYRRRLLDTEKNWKQLTKEDWDHINFDARELALNMTRADSFNYQVGFLGTAAQYISIRHKALQAVLNNKHFTPAQRMRLFGGQVLMFGVEGAGIGGIASWVLGQSGATYQDGEIAGVQYSAKSMKAMVEGGIYDLVMNHVLTQLMQQEELSNVNFSRSMAALGEWDRTIYAMLTNWDNLDTYEVLLGPSYNAMSNTATAIREVSMIFRNPELDTPEKINDAIESFAKALSSGSNQLKAIAGERLGLALDSRGRAISEITDVDGAVKKWLGFSTSLEHEYYQDSALMGSKSGSKASDTVEEVADILASSIRRKVMAGDWEGAKKTAGAVMGLWSDEYERAAIKEALASKLTDLDNVANIDLYGQLAQSFGMASDEAIRTRLMNSAFFINNPQARRSLEAFIQDSRGDN